MKSSIAKLISQYLINENLSEVSNALAKESKISLEPPHIKKLKQYLKNKEYNTAVSFIVLHLTNSEKEAIIPQIRLYQILEMISTKDIPSNKIKIKILKFIRKIQKDSFDKTNLLPKCASIVFGINCKDVVMPNIPIHASSQQALFEYIDNVLSKSGNKKVRTVQSHQLITSLVDLSRKDINSCLYHNCFNEEISLIKAHHCGCELVPTVKALSIDLVNEEVDYIAMSHSHTKLAILCKTNIIYLYSLALCDLELEIVFVKSLYIHLLQITSLMWNYNDTMLISSSHDKSIKIFTEKGDINNKIDFAEMVSYAFLLPNNKIVVSTLDSFIYLYDLSLGVIEQTFPLAIVNEICWSEDTKAIVFSCSSLKEIIIYSDDLLFEKRRIKVNDTIISISLSSEDKGRYLLINSSNKTPVLMLYDIHNGELIRKYFGHRQNNLINKCRFGGAKDNFIIVGGNKKTCIWSINKSIPIYELDFNTGNVNDIIWVGVYPYNTFMISASSDNSITFISNKTIHKFIYAAKVNETQSNIDDDNNHNVNNNNNNNANSPPSNHIHNIYDIVNEYHRYNRFLHFNFFRRGSRIRGRRVDDELGVDEAEADEEEENDDDDDAESGESSESSESDNGDLDFNPQ